MVWRWRGKLRWSWRSWPDLYLHEHAGLAAVAGDSAYEVVNAGFREQDHVLARFVLLDGVRCVAGGVVAQPHLLDVVYCWIVAENCIIGPFHISCPQVPARILSTKKLRKSVMMAMTDVSEGRPTQG